MSFPSRSNLKMSQNMEKDRSQLTRHHISCMLNAATIKPSAFNHGAFHFPRRTVPRVNELVGDASCQCSFHVSLGLAPLRKIMVTPVSKVNVEWKATTCKYHDPVPY